MKKCIGRVRQERSGASKQLVLSEAFSVLSHSTAEQMINVPKACTLTLTRLRKYFQIEGSKSQLYCEQFISTRGAIPSSQCIGLPRCTLNPTIFELQLYIARKHESCCHVLPCYPLLLDFYSLFLHVPFYLCLGQAELRRLSSEWRQDTLMTRRSRWKATHVLRQQPTMSATCIVWSCHLNCSADLLQRPSLVLPAFLEQHGNTQ
jgi:hypothetical protein